MQSKNKSKRRLTYKERRRRRAIRNRITLLSILVIFITAIILISNLIFASNKTHAMSEEKLIKSELGKGKHIQVVKNGTIIKNENENFNKILIPINKKENLISSKITNNVVVVTLKSDALIKLTLDKSIFQNSNDFSIHEVNNTIELRIRGGKANYVFEDPDNSSILQVLTSKVDNPFKHKIVLDPGHGGEDQGTSYEPDKLLEKDLTFAVANKVTPRLIYEGIETIQTRYKDELIFLNDIVRKTASENPEAFVSLHINSNEDVNVSGIEVYYYNKTDALEKEDIHLANSIVTEITKSDNWKLNGTGIKKEDFAVIKSSDMPSVLVEMGFISNKEDRTKLKDNDVIKNLSKNVANGIKQFFNN